MTPSPIRTGFVALCMLALQAQTSVAAPSPKMLTEVVDLSSVAISPDGLSVAFRQEQASVEADTYQTAWLVQDLDRLATARRVADGGLPLRFDYGGAISEPPQWSPDSQWFYYRALFAGEVEVWRATRDGSQTQQVTRDAADVLSFALSHDGRRLIYTVGAARADIERAEQEDDDQGVLIGPRVPLGQGLVRSGYINGRLATQRFTGGWMQRQGLLDDEPTHQVVVDLATLSTGPATAADLAAFADQLSVGPIKAAPTSDPEIDLRVRRPGGDAIAFLQASGAITALHVAPNADAPSSIACDAAPCSDAAISALAWRPGHDEVIFTTADRDRGRAQSLHAWNVSTKAVRLVVHAEGLISGGRGSGPGESCSISSAMAVCVTAAADTPPRLEAVDLDTGRRQVLYDPNQALAETVGPRAQFLRWTDDQGHAFTGQFFPPVLNQPGARAPLFITYYRCTGYLRGGLGDEWPLASLAGAGIAALCVNEPAIDPFHPDQGARYATALSGVKSAIALLQNLVPIDPNRVGMGGLSFGSEVVIWTAMNSNLLAAASVTSAAVTPTYYRLHSLQGPAFLRTLKSIWGLGAPEQTPKRWKLMSPAFNAAKIKTPILMQMPEQEYLAALDYFEPLVEQGTPSELYVFASEPHQKFQPRHKLAAYQRNLDWFRFWLQGYVDPDPLKAEQYQRWRAMRTHAADTGRAGPRR